MKYMKYMHMYKKSFRYLAVLTFLLSCNSNARMNNAERLVDEWVDKTIVFAPDIPCTSAGKDTICPDCADKPFRVLVYSDSTGCTSCKLRLYEWKQLMAEADSTMPELVFDFYFHPKDERALKIFLKRDDFNYPVHIDRNDQLNQLNKFPADEQYQCFLLDGNNKVLLIGNPTNPNVWALYKQMIKGDIKE
ncbi:hypothetical protein FACS189430_07140 [Bacteroidia bacterium]|nr:hypothetical protein FACS189430_07140 [Bacteroidia bacterium]